MSKLTATIFAALKDLHCAGQAIFYLLLKNNIRRQV
jgi:hypothetical protein